MPIFRRNVAAGPDGEVLGLSAAPSIERAGNEFGALKHSVIAFADEGATKVSLKFIGNQREGMMAQNLQGRENELVQEIEAANAKRNEVDGKTRADAEALRDDIVGYLATKQNANATDLDRRR
jgi:cell division septum initiation protein DivIVA